jgi:nitrate/nitrite-specific signal transduction histidine kinase
MFSFRNLRIRSKLAVLITISWVGIAAFAAYALYTLGVVRINGPIYQDLARDQELVADILPPPSYVIESHLTASRMLVAARNNERGSVNALLGKATSLQIQYETRHTYWVKTFASSTDKQISQAFLVDSYQPAEAYFKIFNEEFVPAIQSGQVNKAERIFRNQLTEAYETHRTAIDKVVTLQTAGINQRESEVEALVNRSTLMLVFLAIVIAGFNIGLGIFISRSITVPVSYLTQVAKEISSGKLEARAVSNTTDEVGTLGAALNSMTSQLQDVFHTLEQRVADRAKALTTSAEVTRRLALARNTRQLATEVVEQVQSAFHYYHAHIYFVDAESKDLVMAGGTGEAGATMLARGHKIPNGRGLVGRAASSNTPILVPDVTREEGWLPNPLLPETRAEAAVPIALGDQVLGVLDVQQNVVNGLGEDDISLLQSLAGQVAITLQNARTFEEATAKAEREALINTIGQKIRRAVTVEDALKIAVRELGSAVGASRVGANISPHRHNGNAMGNN